MGRRIILAASDGTISGGEVVLLSIAELLREFGSEPLVVGPAQPAEFVRASEARGFETESLEGRSSAEYALALRRWRRAHRDGVLWCHGLLAAAATAGLPDRIVQFHRLPLGAQHAAARLARLRATATVVPSEFMARNVKGARVLTPWVPEVETVHVPRGKGPLRVGFLGRPSEAKGVHLLAEALVALNRLAPYRFWLRIAGEPRFADARERAFVGGRLAGLGSSVQRLGWMPPDEFLGTIDLLVCPSTVPEGFGLAVAEAMSARVPVVVSDAGALPDVVGPEHPWIASAGDARDLADVIARAAAALPADDAVERAHERWAREFSPVQGRERLREFLDALGLLPDGATAAR